MKPKILQNKYDHSDGAILHNYIIHSKLVNTRFLCYLVFMSTWIQNKRKILGLSQSEVAKSLGISRPTYLKLEQGEAKPTEQQKALLARIFDVSQDTVEKSVAFDANVALDEVEIREIPKENVKKFKEAQPSFKKMEEMSTVAAVKVARLTWSPSLELSWLVALPST